MRGVERTRPSRGWVRFSWNLSARFFHYQFMAEPRLKFFVLKDHARVTDYRDGKPVANAIALSMDAKYYILLGLCQGQYDLALPADSFEDALYRLPG